MQLISEMTHPFFDAYYNDWIKYRLAYIGGTEFIDTYLKKFSSRENDNDFADRKLISYCPAEAAAAINDIKNAIYQRMVDITRAGGPASYSTAITGNPYGVDLQGNSMTGFIGREILTELLIMGQVGIFVDKAAVDTSKITLRESRLLKPYLYYYRAEQIRSWSYDSNNELRSVLLQDCIDKTDVDTELTIDVEYQYRLLKRTPNGVTVTVYDVNNKEVSTQQTQLKDIPFVFVRLSHSLMKNIADYQIALLNLASSDINYAFKSNFPFYTEQFMPGVELLSQRGQSGDNSTVANGAVAGQGAGASAPQQDGRNRDANLGTTQGRRYLKGLDRPGFINPSAEPLRASMEKQEQLKQEIRQLVNLSVANIKPVRASAESKEKDDRGLEAGLSYIGLELEHAERQIAKIWAEYEGEKEFATVKYPNDYSLRSDKDRQEEAARLNVLAPTVPSTTFNKVIKKDVAYITIGHKINHETMEKIFSEIDNAQVTTTDPETIRLDHEAGFISTETASLARGYPKGEVEQAKLDHAERAARIALAQASVSKGSNVNAAARGNDDLSSDPSQQAAAEKKQIQLDNVNTNAGKK